jgi:hypothetical protein
VEREEIRSWRRHSKKESKLTAVTCMVPNLGNFQPGAGGVSALRCENFILVQSYKELVFNPPYYCIRGPPTSNPILTISIYINMSAGMELVYRTSQDQVRLSVSQESQNTHIDASTSQTPIEQTLHMPQDTRKEQPNRFQRGLTWVSKRWTLTIMLSSLLIGSHQPTRTRTLHNQL